MSLPVFTETQRFKTRWPWALVIALNLLFLYAIVQQVILGIPFGNKPASDSILFLLQLLMLGMLYLLFSIKLKTAIDDKGISYRFYPFQTSTTLIEWTDLSDAYMRTYNSFYEFGGWGIRVGIDKNKRAINTSASSNEGLQLEFKDGRSLLIGTRRPAELKNIIDEKTAAGKIKWGS